MLKYVDSISCISTTCSREIYLICVVYLKKRHICREVIYKIYLVYLTLVDRNDLDLDNQDSVGFKRILNIMRYGKCIEDSSEIIRSKHL